MSACALAGLLVPLAKPLEQQYKARMTPQGVELGVEPEPRIAGKPRSGRPVEPVEAPMWRAAGGVCQVELEGISQIVARDGTAVVIDARESAEFHKGTLKGARNIPRSLVLEGKDVGEVKRAKDDSRLPMEDHNTRILVIGADGEAARYVAGALAREAFHNVSYFAGSFATVQKSLTHDESR